MPYVPFGILDAGWQEARGEGLTAAPQWKIGGDVYLTYRLYGKDEAAGGLPGGPVAADKLPAGAPAGVPAGLSWKTATYDPETLVLASEAYKQDDTTFRNVWLDATDFDDTVSWTDGGTLMGALAVLDKTLALDTDPDPAVEEHHAGYAQYDITEVQVSTHAMVPSMKLTTTGAADYVTGDAAKNGLTFPNMGNLKTPLSITITGLPDADGELPTLYLNEKGSMFWLDKLDNDDPATAPLTLIVDNISIWGLSTDYKETTTIVVPTESLSARNIDPYVAPADNTAALIYVGKNNTFEMKRSAELKGNKNTTSYGNNPGGGGGVWVEGGTFLMSGDYTSIHDNSAYRDGGGVYVDQNGTFEMSGDHATISNNTVTNGAARRGGGGVSVRGIQGASSPQNVFSTFIMKGTNAKISGNRAAGVAVPGAPGGAVPGAAARGGGVNVYLSHFVMEGANAEISGNTTTGIGGGVYVESTKGNGILFTMSGTNAKISRNRAESTSVGGGGVELSGGDDNEVIFSMVSGSIVDNSHAKYLKSSNFYASDSTRGTWPAGTQGYEGEINTPFDADTTLPVGNHTSSTDIVRIEPNSTTIPGKNLWAVKVTP
jgi:hypothetical protein